jgi:tryptophan synthase alpha subunit
VIARKNDIHVIATVSPDTPDERLAEIAKRASGFVYAMSSNMTTGSSGDFGV